MRTLVWKTISGFAIALLALLTGCGEAGSTTYPVSGSVTWQGQPLAEGQIVVEPEKRDHPGTSGKIVQGRFSFRSGAGRHLIRIYATRPAANIDAVMGAPPQEQYLPERYNHATTLTAEIVPDGKNELSFALTDQGS